MSVINFWLDAALLLLLLVLGWVSATLQIEFPAPTLTGGWTLWSLTYDQWRDVQFATLCTFGFGILVHVMLHWNWVCSVITTQVLHTRERLDEGMQTIYGVATLIVLLHLQRFTLVLHTVRHGGTSRGCPGVSRAAAPRPRHHRASSSPRLDGDLA